MKRDILQLRMSKIGIEDFIKLEEVWTLLIHKNNVNLLID